MTTSLLAAAEPFDCATCGGFVRDGDLIAKVDDDLLCEWCAERLPDFVAPTPLERDHLVRHGVPASEGHDHWCERHDVTVHHSADDCRPSNYCPDGCLMTSVRWKGWPI